MKAKCDWNKASPVEPLDRLAVPKKALTHWTKLWQLQVLHPMFCTLNSKGYLPQQPCLHPPHQFCRVALKRKTEKIGKSTWVNSSLKTFIAILRGMYVLQTANKLLTGIQIWISRQKLFWLLTFQRKKKYTKYIAYVNILFFLFLWNVRDTVHYIQVRV